MRRGARLLLALAVVSAAAGVAAGGADGPGLSVELDPREATVGDPLTLVIELRLAGGMRIAGADPGPELGPFTVLEGGWEPPPRSEGDATVHTWRGTIAAYRTGELELPPITVRVEGRDGAQVARGEPVAVTIRSVLPPAGEGDPVELADLKPPASVPADYRALRAAVALVLLLLLGALLAWYLARRFGDRLAARPVPEDPFHRVPPHVWVYGELQRLLERRLAEQGRVDEFHAELARILKRYLGGRYRVELMERTTSETLPVLRQAGAGAAALQEVRRILERCDQVKFAAARPAPESCRQAVEDAYRIVDATRPAEPAAAGDPRARGAA